MNNVTIRLVFLWYALGSEKHVLPIIEQQPKRFQNKIIFLKKYSE